MANMRNTQESENDSEVECCSPEYPYGLELRLETEQLTKLGITIPPAVGAELMVMARVTVVSSSQRQQLDSDPEICSCWQITDMEIAPVPAKKSAKEKYSNSKMND